MMMGSGIFQKPLLYPSRTLVLLSPGCYSYSPGESGLHLLQELLEEQKVTLLPPDGGQVIDLPAQTPTADL